MAARSRPTFRRNNSTGDNNEANSSHHRLARCAGPGIAGARCRSCRPIARLRRWCRRSMTGRAFMSACSVVAAGATRTSTIARGPIHRSPTTRANYPSQGGLGGGEAGYNLQSGSVVVGIEATGFWSNINGNDAVAVGQGLFPNVTSVDADNLRWGGTLRARGGVTVDRLMLFFTGGWAFGDIQHTNTASLRSCRRRPVHGSCQRPGRRRRHRLRADQQPDRQDRIQLLQFQRLQPPRGGRDRSHVERPAPLHHREHLFDRHRGPRLQVRRPRGREILTRAAAGLRSQQVSRPTEKFSVEANKWRLK